MNEVDLIFPGLSQGSHQTPWDLRILLYRGATDVLRKEALTMIDRGIYGDAQSERKFLAFAFHENITSLIKKGKSRALVISSLETLWRFYSWADNNYPTITETNIIEIFKGWAEYQIYRSQKKKEISEVHGYRQTTRIAKLIAGSLKLPGAKPSAYLMLQTRMRRPNDKKSVLSTQADKQNLENTFAFGHALKKICDTLDVPTVRGALPIFIEITDNKTLIVSGSLLNPLMDVESIKNNTVRRNAERARAPLADHESLFERYKRSGILNLRIESELLIFIAQTGMNSAQAANLKRETYRWKTVGDDLDVFRVYKGRRGGEAIFRCYKGYREHLERYLIWLNETGFSEFDDRLFPLQSRAIIKPKDTSISFGTSKGLFRKIDVSFFGPQDLRKTRVNWLLRRSQDLDLTAEQMAHDKQVLIRDYQRPHHQSAASEIVKFHKATDPTFLSPGPGLCADKDHNPEPVSNILKGAPGPDCISPEGCLFCSKHRDIMSADYCWKLASHAKIKNLETSLYKPSMKQEAHPAHHVIERINQKLDEIASGNEVRAMWVKDSRDAIRAGNYHPYWNGYIQLMEIMA